MGPLNGMKVIELAGIGPGPMCAMLLADLGATVLRIDRKHPIDLGTPRPLKYNLLLRNRKSIALDLKQPAAVELVLKLVSDADGLIEGFRPGVVERLGLGPDACLRAQSATRVRTHDRLGTERSSCRSRRARHQLHRARRCAAFDRTQR
jgi:crotonobetainyl-CoA:carnitine CoA-transferase CaiB-like acyl-CoA transferase